MGEQRPILFSTPMVQAILEGRKTQTRRIIDLTRYATTDFEDWFEDGRGFWPSIITDEGAEPMPCRYGNKGDILWVRETWCLTQPYNPESYYFGYKTGPCSRNEASEKYNYSTPDVWRPSIHMPKEAARIFLEITNVRVERLQEISETDAYAEGVNACTLSSLTGGYFFKYGFQKLWYAINGHESWNANPWVWVIEFKKGGGL